jgi:hypothetical protein
MEVMQHIEHVAKQDLTTRGASFLPRLLRGRSWSAKPLCFHEDLAWRIRIILSALALLTTGATGPGRIPAAFTAVSPFELLLSRTLDLCSTAWQHRQQLACVYGDGVVMINVVLALKVCYILLCGDSRQPDMSLRLT